MATVLSCVNLKGGVGKTAIAVNFAAYCGREGMRTLLVDCDPQTNATFSCIQPDEWGEHTRQFGTLANLLGVRSVTADANHSDPHTIIRKNVFPNVDLVPSHIGLFSIDLELSGASGRELRLRKALKPVLEHYDMVVCDCPPNLTIPTQNAIAMSTHYLVPVPPDYLSILGIALLTARIKELCDSIDHEITNAGIVVSRVGRKASHRENIVAGLRERFPQLVLQTELRERVAVTESAAMQKPVFAMGDEQATQEFSAMSQELLQRLNGNTAAEAAGNTATV
jgi:chromosome partitioning protein